MQRLFGAIAILAGWLSIPVGAMAGLIVSQFFGLSHVEGDVAPSAVYGMTGAVVLWVFVAAALVAALPVAVALVAPDPRRQIRMLAAVMVIGGVALFPDDLGRAFGLPLLAGAACMWVGGDLIYLGSAAASTGRGAGGPDADVHGVDAAAAIDAPAVAAPNAVDPALTGPTAPPDPGLPPTTAPSASSEPPRPATRPETGRGRRGSSTARSSSQRLCPWCSTQVPARAISCPNCQATLDEPAAGDISIPGLTEVPPNLRRYAEDVRTMKKRPSVLSIMFTDSSIPTAIDPPAPSDTAALQPPSQALKAEMARLDAEIASGALPPDPPGKHGQPRP